MDTRWFERGIVVAIAAVVAVVGTACIPEPTGSLPAPTAWVEPDAVDSRSGRSPVSHQVAHVAVIGDSLTYQAEYGLDFKAIDDPTTPRDLTAAFLAAGFGVSTSLQYGATTFGLAQLPDWPAPVADVVVIALGTNDRHDDAHPLEQSQANLDTYLARWPDTCVVLVTIAETPVWGLDVYGPAWNAFLRDRADVVADWAAIAADHPEYLLDDLVHHNAEGAEAYRELIVGASKRCVATTPGR